MEFSLLWSAALGFGLAWAALRRTTRYPNPAALVDPLWGAVGVGVFGGRIGSMIGNGTNPLTAPGDILLIRGGVSTAVASVCAIAIWLYAVRDDMRRASDAAAPALLIGLAGWHAGCLFRDACAGTVSDAPWAITLAGSDVGRHPVELYAAVLLIAAALAVARIPVGSGAAFASGVAAAALVRIATEPFRLSIGGGPVLAYALSIVIGVIAAVVLWRRGPTESADQTGSTLAE